MDKQYANKVIGRNIKRVRESLGMTQQELADKCGCWKSKVSLYNIESGQHGLTSVQLEKVAKALNTTPGNLLNSDSSPSSAYSEYMEYLPYLAKADIHTLKIVRAALDMPPFHSSLSNNNKEAVND